MCTISPALHQGAMKVRHVGEPSATKVGTVSVASDNEVVGYAVFAGTWICSFGRGVTV